MSSKSPKLSKAVMPNLTNVKDLKEKLSNYPLIWVVRILLVIYAAFCAPNLNSGVASLFDNVIVRLIFAVLIIFLAYVDPASSILLAVSFVISIQTLNKLKVNNLQQNFVDMNNNGEEEHHSVLHEGQKVSAENPQLNGEETEAFTNHAEFQNPEEMHNSSVDEQAMGNMMNSSYGQTAEVAPEMMQESKQMSEEQMMLMKHQEAQKNISVSNNDHVFTSNSQMHDAQTNQVANNQVAQVQTWANQLGPQGLNQPTGYNFNPLSSGDPLARNAATF